jgi:2-dehydro-3-deoxyphosphogluconate aldolase / (4S)-4-hydroxy-2-oxoglutarate aldolase
MKNLFWIPGCATITEVHTAKTLGATLIKAFPGNLLGAAFIKAVLSVMPELKNDAYRRGGNPTQVT